MSKHHLIELVALHADAPETAPVCAWVSRHQPTLDQREALRGYDIVRLNCRTPVAHVIWHDILDACVLTPSLVMLITAREALPAAVRHIKRASPDTIVIRPVMEPAHRGWRWTGAWRELVVIRRLNGSASVAQLDWQPARQPAGKNEVRP